ncbi:hypothetical protein [Celerinatantimonas sp. MCCC 1A17872]|uniref:hypothetical protein n=1 Tax=Celerinatantimonas sp. MCCC 1A17872 TaxID=3177514 RepID=UPI0038CA59C3
MEPNQQCEFAGALTPNNRQTQFIAKHVRIILTERGYSHSTVERGVREAIRTYHHEGNFPRGKVFDVCLAAALHLVKPIKIKTKPAAKSPKKSVPHFNKAA